MSDRRQDDGPAPAPVYEEHPPQSFSPPALSPAPGDPALAVALSKAEIDSAIATARAFPRDLRRASQTMMQMATYNPAIAEDCIYSLPRGGKQIRGPSIRFAEIIRHAWGNCRDGARVIFIDRIDRAVECEAMFHDLETNIATTASVRRTIELKRGRTSIDLDMTQLAGAAGMSIARRNAILGGIPRFVWQPVIDQIERVIRGDEKTLAERRERAIGYWGKAGIGVERLIKALSRETTDDITLDDLVTMTGWRTALTQGDVTLDEIFPEERKPSPKQSLDGKLDALAPHGEAASTAPQGAASLPEGAPSNAPAGQGADASASAPEAEEERRLAHHIEAAKGPPGGLVNLAANSGAGAKEQKAGIAAPPQGKQAASGPAKPADKASERRAALAAKGAEVAARGNDNLMEWLDGLPGDQAALITPLMEKLWKEAAEKADGDPG